MSLWILENARGMLHLNLELVWTTEDAYDEESNVKYVIEKTNKFITKFVKNNIWVKMNSSVAFFPIPRRAENDWW